MKKMTIGFICTHNSCRSIIAEAWAKHFNNELFEIYSAGTINYPAPKPLAIEVMEDLGIGMSESYSKLLNEIPNELDILITMGCGVDCPYVPTKHREDWGLDDPSGGSKEDFIQTRDLIKLKVIELFERIETNTLKD